MHCLFPPSPKVPNNHPSALDHPHIVDSKLAKEISAGRILGPFRTPPFPDLVCSPLGLVPKKAPNEFRLIHNLSFPRGDSINEGIPQEFSAVSYQDLDHCISIIQSIGPGTLIAKGDLESAFRLLPIHPRYFRFLGFTWRGSFYVDACLPMGLSESCHHFETFSTALQWILQQAPFSVPFMSHILDDFIFMGPPESDVCTKSLQKFLILTEDLHIPINQAKTVWPSTTVELHGIEVDSIRMELRLPPDKLAHAFQTLLSLKGRSSVTLRELQSALGFLNFATKAIPHGRPFLRRLTDLTKGMSRPSHHIRLTKESRLDIQAWLSFLEQFNGVSIFLEPVWSPSNSVSLYSDASGVGFAAVFGNRYLQGRWPTSWLHHSIALKELFPITLAIELWGNSLSNKRIMFFCDNSSVVSIINSQTSKQSDIMRLVRRLTIASMSFNILFRAQHIPGVDNVVSDRLSRFAEFQARLAAPALNSSPDAIPPRLQPW
jgi:hypothetical protein